ncbi:MAG: hypothetical protein HON90_12310 [Halobacteriovoraceae bacterium]|jgi:4-hydroxysphinganine ceramide fatty acyl 2-hydroxylase|nr:hypothetical protein [Halobacteriovoraceae bacterium]
MQTLIEKYPRLRTHLMHNTPIKGQLSALPMLIMAIYLLTQIEWSWISLSVGTFLGVAYWTFFEYAMHRFLYHRIFKSKFSNELWQSFHMFHHRNIQEKSVLNANYLFLIPMALVNISILYIISLGKLNVLLFAVISLVISYMFYEWVHYSIHTNPFKNNYIQYISKYHLHHHHKTALKNFGNTSSFWDIVLGTYDANYKKIDLNSVEY